jgi:hypothetical protein
MSSIVKAATNPIGFVAGKAKDKATTLASPFQSAPEGQAADPNALGGFLGFLNNANTFRNNLINANQQNQANSVQANMFQAQGQQQATATNNFQDFLSTLQGKK